MGNDTRFELDLSDMSAKDVADVIADWRTDSDAAFCAAIDLLDSIEDWLRAQEEEAA